MTASWSGHEPSSVDELLRQYWTDAIISHLCSSESVDSVAFKGCISLVLSKKVKG